MNESNKIIKLLLAQNTILTLLLKGVFHTSNKEAENIYYNILEEAGLKVSDLIEKENDK